MAKEASSSKRKEYKFQGKTQAAQGITSPCPREDKEKESLWKFPPESIRTEGGRRRGGGERGGEGTTNQLTIYTVGADSREVN